MNPCRTAPRSTISCTTRPSSQPYSSSWEPVGNLGKSEGVRKGFHWEPAGNLGKGWRTSDWIEWKPAKNPEESGNVRGVDWGGYLLGN